MAIGQKLFSKNPITGSSCRSLDISLVVSCGYLYTAKFSEQPFVETYAGLLLEKVIKLLPYHIAYQHIYLNLCQNVNMKMSL